MVVLLFVSNNQVWTLLLLVHPHVIKYIRNQESNLKKSLLSHNTCYLGDDDHKSVDFDGETI